MLPVFGPPEPTAGLLTICQNVAGSGCYNVVDLQLARDHRVKRVSVAASIVACRKPVSSSGNRLFSARWI